MLAISSYDWSGDGANMDTFIIYGPTWTHSSYMGQHGHIHHIWANMDAFIIYGPTWTHSSYMNKHGHIHHTWTNMDAFIIYGPTWTHSSYMDQHGHIHHEIPIWSQDITIFCWVCKYQSRLKVLFSHCNKNSTCHRFKKNILHVNYKSMKVE